MIQLIQLLAKGARCFNFGSHFVLVVYPPSYMSLYIISRFCRLQRLNKYNFHTCVCVCTIHLAYGIRPLKKKRFKIIDMCVIRYYSLMLNFPCVCISIRKRSQHFTLYFTMQANACETLISILSTTRKWARLYEECFNEQRSVVWLPFLSSQAKCVMHFICLENNSPLLTEKVRHVVSL